MPRPPIDLKDPRKAALLAWLVPGLGHIYQGRNAKGLLYAFCILGLYTVGLMLGEGQVVYWRWSNPMNDPENFRISFIGGQIFVGLPALPALVQATLKYFGHDPILGGFMAEPTINAVNAMHPRLGKFLEVATVYTWIAGLLNVLAIFDAYAGPAYGDEDAAAGPEAAAASSAAGNEAQAEARA